MQRNFICMNYTQNGLGCALQSFTVELHLPFRAAFRRIPGMKPRNVLAMVSPMSSARVNGIARYAKEHGWNLMIQDRLGHTPLAWNGDGILATLRSDPMTFRCIEKLMQRGIPLVDLTVSRPEINVPRVTSDHREIGRLAAQHFAEREFRHVAWFSSGWGNVHRLRYQGLADGKAGKPLKWVVADEIPVQRQSEWTSFVEWIRGKFLAAEKPLAVLTYDETDAARLLYATKELGVNVPEELAILSIGNNPLVCENQSVPLSSIDQNLERGGYEAAALLDRLMTAKTRRDRGSGIGDRANRTILIPPAGVVTRRSTDVVAVADPTVRNALLFISAHLGDPIGAPQIADALGCRRAELDLLFRTKLDRSVGEEIRRQRLARVKLLLQTTTLPVSKIARKTGFCTPSHLTNAFKTAFRLPPKAWRSFTRTDRS